MLAKCSAIVCAVNDRIKRLVCCTDCAHAVVDTARTKAALCNLESAPWAEDHVCHGNTDVLEDDLRVVMDVPEDAKGTNDGDTGRVTGHNDHRVAIVERVSLALGKAHEDEDFTFRAARSADVPLMPIDDIFASLLVQCNACTDVCCIAACHAWFCHGICAADFPGQQGLEPLLLLFRISKLLKHLHVACVRGIAIHGIVGNWIDTQDLSDGRVLQDTEFANLREEEVVQPASLCFLPHFSCHRGEVGRPGFASCVSFIFARQWLAGLHFLLLCPHLRTPFSCGWNDVFLDKLNELLSDLEEVGTESAPEWLKLRGDVFGVKDVAHRVSACHGFL